MDRTYYTLELVFYPLVKTHTFTFFVAIVVEKRSSVAPNHNAFLRLSGSLGTYSNKL